MRRFIIDLWYEIGGMSLREFESRHTLAELNELAAHTRVIRDERERDERKRRVESQAQNARGKA